MKELSLNILDIAQNSISAGASLIEISIIEDDETMTISVKDNGCGMSKELRETVSDPFTTTRKTRKVGLGIPFFSLAAMQTGGNLTIESKTASEDPENHGTTIKALFYKNHIDFTPLGDIISTLCTLIQSCKDYDIVFIHEFADGSTVSADTREFKEALDGVPLDNPEVIIWIRDYLAEQYKK